MYVVHPSPGEKSYEEEPYRYANYAAYYRQFQSNFWEMIGTELVIPIPIRSRTVNNAPAATL
ncbi:MAG: hypothetical protein R2806_20415 [Saprospiraceae bacterium]